MAYLIQETPVGSNDGMVLRGAVKRLWGSKNQEEVVSGPAETGKTIGCLTKANAMLWKYPGCQGVVARKTFSTMQGSVLQSYENKILGPTFKTVIKPYGGEKPQWYDYPNGSRLWVAGLDNADKILSSERDFIYVNQAEELTEDDWEYMLTRTTGRAGNMPYSQLFGDCNPKAASHWIKQRFGRRLLESRHEDNPSLFDDNGNITEQGVRSLAALDALTGLRKERLRYGKWTSAEGVCFERWDDNVNLITRAEVPKCYRRIEVVDFGFTHPFCWQNWHIDHDGRIYVVQELYITETMVEDCCSLINQAVVGDIRPEAVIADWDAEDRATFRKYRGIETTKANKRLGYRPMIEAVNKRLAPAGDGKARFFYCEDAPIYTDQKLVDSKQPTSSKDEVGGYVWNKHKDEPVKQWDHAMDDWRYGVAHLDLSGVVKVVRRSTSLSYGSM